MPDCKLFQIVPIFSPFLRTEDRESILGKRPADEERRWPGCFLVWEVELTASAELCISAAGARGSILGVSPDPRQGPRDEPHCERSDAGVLQSCKLAAARLRPRCRLCGQKRVALLRMSYKVHTAILLHKRIRTRTCVCVSLCLSVSLCSLSVLSLFSLCSLSVLSLSLSLYLSLM